MIQKGYSITISRFAVSALVLGTVLFLGCASISKSPESASLDAKTFAPPEDRGSVFLYREGRAVGAAVQYQVKVNGMDAGGTGSGTFFRWDLKPGTYALASSTTESSAAVQVEVEVGKLYFFKQMSLLGLKDGGRIFINPVDEPTGKMAVSELQLLVSAYLPESSHSDPGRPRALPHG